MKNNRRQYLINPNFQLKFAFLITLAMFVFNMAFPLFILNMFETSAEHSLVTNNPIAQNALNQARKEFIALMVVLETCFVLMTFVLAIFHSHKIAGPLYKLKISMQALKQGVLDRHISFRAKDNFPELADEFNDMSDAIFARRRKELEAINNILPTVEKLHTKLGGNQKKMANEVLQSLQSLSRGAQQND